MKYLILLFLVGCTTDIRYGDKVTVTDGFHKGRTGTVVDYYRWFGKDKCEVQFADNEYRYIVCADLKKE